MAWNKGDILNYYVPDVVTEVKLTQQDIEGREKRLNEPFIVENEYERYERLMKIIGGLPLLGDSGSVEEKDIKFEYFNAESWCEVEGKDTWRLAREIDDKIEYFDCSCAAPF